MLLGALAASGCGDGEPQLPPVRAELGRVQYRSDTDLSACPDAPERVQDRIYTLERVLGFRGPDTVTYVHLLDSAHYEWPCVEPGQRCASGARIFTDLYVHNHEIVHAVMSPLGRPNALLTEGFGTALGYNSVRAPLTPLDWRELVSAPVGSSDTALYRSGAALVTWLYERYGPEPLIDLFRRATTDTTQFEALFEQLFEVSLDDAWAAAHERGSTYVCEGLEDNTARGWIENVPHQASCPGPVANARHVFEFDSLTALALETNYHEAHVHACGPDETVPTPILDSDWGGAPALYLGRWPAGRYFINRGSAGALAPDEESLRMEEGAFIGRRCTEPITPLAYRDVPRYLQLWLDSERERYLALDWQGSGVLDCTVKAAIPVAARWRACRACQPDACVSLQAGATLRFEPGVTFLRGELRPGAEPQELRLYARCEQEAG